MIHKHAYRHDDELLDIVNEHDQVVGTIYRSDAYVTGIAQCRVINAFIMNDDGLVWIPRRSAGKKLFPLHLDASVGGHVQAGETYLQAFERELREELNLDLSDVSYASVAYLNPHQHNVSAHMQVYVIKYNQTPPYNTDDFVSSLWLSIAELQQAIRQGEPIKGDLSVLIDFLARWCQKER